MLDVFCSVLKPDSKKIVGVCLRFIRNLNTTKHRMFRKFPTYGFWKPSENEYFCKSRFQENRWGWPKVYQKAEYYQKLGFFGSPRHVHLEYPRKKSLSEKPDFKKIVGVALVVSESWIFQNIGFSNAPRISISENPRKTILLQIQTSRKS